MSWSRVVREGSEGTTVAGGSASAPMDTTLAPSSAMSSCPVAPPQPDPEPCFLECSEEILHTETELHRAVLVSMVGTRPYVDVADAAAAVRRHCKVGPPDMSIRTFAPEDFLIICEDMRTRDKLVAAERIDGPWFNLRLRPWMRQAQAMASTLN